MRECVSVLTGGMEEVHALRGLVGHLGFERERDLWDQIIVQQLYDCITQRERARRAGNECST
jgi:hypothetical protein